MPLGTCRELHQNDVNCNFCMLHVIFQESDLRMVVSHQLTLLDHNQCDDDDDDDSFIQHAARCTHEKG